MFIPIKEVSMKTFLYILLCLISIVIMITFGWFADMAACVKVERYGTEVNWQTYQLFGHSCKIPAELNGYSIEMSATDWLFYTRGEE